MGSLKSLQLHKLSCIFVDYFETAKRHLEFTVPGLVTGPCVAEKYFTMKNEDSATHSRHKVLQKFQSRVVSDTYWGTYLVCDICIYIYVCA